MTDLTNGQHPTNPITQQAAFGRGARPPEKPQLSPVSAAAKRSQVHPKQAHLNTLIHAKIVTHLVHVDEVPDTLFALSQMQDLPEVRFAAIFDDGLIALGCPSSLPEALATIAVPAIPTGPAESSNAAGVQRIEQVSRRLETMVNAMEPDEVILNDQLGQSILDRLTSLETQIANVQTDKTAPQLQIQIAALQDTISDALDPDPGVALLEAKLSDILQRINSTAEQMQTQSELTQAAISDSYPTIEEGTLTRLTAQMTRLEHTLTSDASIGSNQTYEIEKMIKSLMRSAPATPKPHPEAEQVSDKIDQLSAAQRTAFTRIEAAMTKAVSGLEPALDHLNARAADTENMMSDWHKDLKTLSQHTRSIADSTGQLPPVFTALQSDVTTLANRPAPVLDLTAQQEGFAHFSSDLRNALTAFKSLAQVADEKATKTAAQADETIVILQTLPNLISATLRHDVDLKPIEQSIAELQVELTALPTILNLPAIKAGIVALSDQITPINDAQIIEFEGLQKSIRSILSELDTLGQGVNGLHAKDPDLDPLKEVIKNVSQQLTHVSQDHEGQIELLRETLTNMAQHLGVTPRHQTSLVASSPLAPDTSLNTLRMEFADLITKRIKENNVPFTAEPRQA